MIYIIYAYFGEKSSARLAEMVGGKCHNTLNDLFVVKSPSDLVIRWGTVNTINNDAGCRVRNFRDNILASSDKMNARIVMRDNGIPCPDVFKYSDDIPLPAIGRPLIHAAQQDFYVCRTKKNIEDAYNSGAKYFSPIFEKTHEFRVHTGSGKVLFIQDKHVTKRNVKCPMRKWTVVDWDDYIPSICLASLKAADAFALDFAAVDVMYNNDTGEVSICEVNCAPAIESDFQRLKYCNYFKWLNMTKDKRQFWDFDKIKDGKWAWRDVQFAADIPKEMRA